MKDTDRTTKTTEKVSGKGKFNGEEEGANRKKVKLILGETGREQVMINLEGGQQIGEQAQCPDKGEGDGSNQGDKPVEPFCMGDVWESLAFPQRRPAAGAQHQFIDGLNHREVGTEPAAIEPSPAPRRVDKGSTKDKKWQKTA